MVDDLEEKFGRLRPAALSRRSAASPPAVLDPAFSGLGVVWGASWVLAPTYRSGTLILVEQPTMPKDYVTPNVNDDLQDRLRSITQQILSRTRLLHIIDQLNLYASAHSQLTPMRKSNGCARRLKSNWCATRSNRVSSFNVYYSAHDPHVAQQVTSELTNLVHQREPGSAAAAIGRHDKVSREPVGNRAPNFVGPGREDSPVQRAARGRVAGTGGQQSADSGRAAIPAANGRRCAEYGQATTRVSRNLGESIPLATRHAKECWRRDGECRVAGDRRRAG